MITKFKRMGYREGFSMGAIPQDYRIFAATNKFNVINFDEDG